MGYYLHRMFVVVAICHLQYRSSFKRSPQSVFGIMFTHLGIAIIHDSPEQHPRGGKIWSGFAFTVLIARNLVRWFLGKSLKFNCCHQMSYFKAKMHKIRFWLGLRPRPRCPRPLSCIKGALLLRGREEDRKGRERGGRLISLWWVIIRAVND